MNEIVPSISIQNLVNQREGVAALLRQGIAALREASQLAVVGGMGFPDINIEYRGDRASNIAMCGGADKPERPEEIITKILAMVDAGAWRNLMDASGLRTFMDSTARNEWDVKVRECRVPSLTWENIEATFLAMHANRGAMFESGVVGVFRKLSWDYKTNQPFKFGKRIILQRLFTCYGSGSKVTLSLNSRNVNDLDDLDRVFHILDGKPEPDHRIGWDHKISTSERRKDRQCSGEYFDMKWFLKGTGHVVFKRPDLVNGLNLILARHFPDALAYEPH